MVDGRGGCHHCILTRQYWSLFFLFLCVGGIAYAVITLGKDSIGKENHVRIWVEAGNRSCCLWIFLSFSCTCVGLVVFLGAA